MSSGKGGSKSQITGYRYFMALHSGLCRGPINALREIRVGDLVAWLGEITFSQFGDIDVPYLFGGDTKEGGIKGTFKAYLGEADQTIDSVVTDNIEGGFPVPGWRGVSSVFYYGQIGSNNPYPKPWKFRVSRTTAGWDDDDPWEPDLASLSASANPVTTVSFNRQPRSGETIMVGDQTLRFVTNYYPWPHTQIAGTVEETAARWANNLNAHTNETYDVTATASGSLVTLQFPTTVAVTSAGSFLGEWVTIVQNSGDISGMNPAHILFECATNSVWGRGLPRSLIDIASFRAAALTMIDEGFAMCIRWNRQEDIDKFVQLVVSHIGAAVYFDRRTGLLTLKLIRADYDADSLEIFSFDHGILEITEDTSSSADTSYNEIIVAFVDPVSGKKGMVRAQDLASFQSLGSVISTTVEYLGCPTAALAARLAQRDLQISSSDLRRFKIKMDRHGWDISPAGVFRIQVPSRGIGNMILRAGSIEDGTLEDGTITIDAVQDVFGMPKVSFVTPQQSFWTPTDRAAQAIDERYVGEETYFDLAQNAPPSEQQILQHDTGFIKVFAESPSSATIDYTLITKFSSDANYPQDGTVAGFDAGSNLAEGIGPYDTDITFDEGTELLDEIVPGIPVLLVDSDKVEEYCRLDAFDRLLGTATIARGCIDTVPHRFAKGSKLWFQSHMPTTDFRSYSNGEIINTKLLSRTSAELLNPLFAPTDIVTIGGRQGRPYPPGNVQVNGILVFNVHLILDEDLAFTWAHRDRVVEGDFLLEHGAGSTGPEPGTSYNIRVYDGGTGATLLRSDNTTGPNWTYTAAMNAADGNLNSYWFELESMRDGLVSWQKYRFKIAKSIGFNQGFNWNFDGTA